jgi:hypothetical protein
VIINNEKFKNINIYVTSKKTQFQHFHNLINHVMEYKFIMFCDDDDTYETNRIELFINAYKNTRRRSRYKYFMIHENIQIGQQNNILIHDEYICYAIEPSILCSFFDLTKSNDFIINSNYCDIVFREWLRGGDLRNQIQKIEFNNGKNTYNYRRNSNSICGAYNFNKTIESDNKYNYSDLLDKYKSDLIKNEFIDIINQIMFVDCASWRLFQESSLDKYLNIKCLLDEIYPEYRKKYFEIWKIFDGLYYPSNI